MSERVRFRPVTSDDAEKLWAMLEVSHGELAGMISLPSNLAQSIDLTQRSHKTVQDLAAGSLELEEGESRALIFVLEASPAPDYDPDAQEIVGVTGAWLKKKVPNLAVSILTSDDGAGLVAHSWTRPWSRTELGATFLAAQARGAGHGALLSRGRLLFLHLVKSQIPAWVVAHIRGIFEDDGTAPFWTSFGTRFKPDWPTSVDAEEAIANDPSDIVELHDRTVKLDDDILRYLGPVHTASRPAYQMLRSEGLQSNGMYDPVDGGPTIACDISETFTAKSRVVGAARIVADPNKTATDTLSSDMLVSNLRVPSFFATRSGVEISDGNVSITESVAQTLQIGEGSLVAAVPRKPT